MSWSICMALIAASLICKQRSGSVAGLLYCLVSVIHWQAFQSFNPHSPAYSSYYLLAATLDALVVSVLMVSDEFVRHKKIFVPLSITMIASIVNNIFGLYLWQFELEPATYNYIGTLIYLVFALLLIWNRVNAQLVGFYSHMLSYVLLRYSDSQKASKKEARE